MAAIFHVDEGEKKSQLILIFTDPSKLSEILLEEYKTKGKIIFVSENHFVYDNKERTKEEGIYLLSFGETPLLPQLEEQIDYAIINLSSESQKQYLEPVIKKLLKDRTRTEIILPAEKLEEFSDIILEYKGEKEFRFALLGETIDTKKIEQGSELSKIIGKAILNKEIALTGNDLFPIYPISLDDALKGIDYLLFGKHDNTSLFFLYYQHPETILSAVHILARIEPDLEMVFNEQLSEESTKYPPAREDILKTARTKLQLKEKYIDNIFDGFEKTVKKLFELTPEEGIVFPTPVSPDGHDRRKSVRKKLVPSIPAKTVFKNFLIGTAVFIIINLILFAAGLFFLRQSILAYEKEEYSKVALPVKLANILLSTVRPTAFLIADSSTIVDRQGTLIKAYIAVDRGLSLATLGEQTVKDISTKKDLSQNEIEILSSHLIFLYQEAERLSIEYNNAALKKILRPEYSKLLSMSQIVANLLGFSAEKNYLLLFQNNGELRPTGGFIGSIGELRINKGKVEDLTIRDVYDLDGQIKTHVEPPFIVRRYLQPHLYLRDSNFNPDFQYTASIAAKIYNLETQKQPDGVMAINFEVLKQVMKIMGPMDIPEYNVTVSADNIFDFLQDTIKTGFFPGSTQKRDVLTKVFNKLLIDLEQNPQKLFLIARILPDALEEKNLLISMNQSTIQNTITANGYSGSITDNREKEQKTAYDYLHINEANIGVNKANTDITRSVSYESIITDEKFDSKVQLKITNSHAKEDYKTYIQTFVPKGSSLKKISINNVEQKIVPAITNAVLYEKKGFKAPEGLEVEEYTNGNFNVFAFIAEIKKGTSDTIEISYENGARIPLTSRTSYSFSFVKQPGIPAIDLSASFYYPEDYSSQEAKASSNGRNFVKFDDSVRKDLEHSFILKRKD